MRTKVLPKNYNHEAFYIKFKNIKFRVYKMEYFFSSVCGAWVLEFFISHSDLEKFKKSKYYENGTDSIYIADIPKSKVDNIVDLLKTQGFIDLISSCRTLKENN